MISGPNWSTNSLNSVTSEEEELAYVGRQNLVPVLTGPVETHFTLAARFFSEISGFFTARLLMIPAALRRRFTVETDGGDGEFEKTSRLNPGAVSLGLVLGVFKIALALNSAILSFPTLQELRNARLCHAEHSCQRHHAVLYISARLISLTNTAVMSAKELLMASHLVLPIICLEKYIDDEITASYTLAISCILRALYSEGLGKKELCEMAYAIESLGSMWEAVFSPETTTIKTHAFFAHLPTQLRQCGNVIDLDSSGFEHSYMDYKIQLNPHNTRNFDLSALERLLLSRHSLSEMESRSVDTAIRGLRRLYERRQRSRKRGAKPITKADPQPARHPLPNAYAYPSYHALLQNIGSERSIVIYPRVYTRGMTLASHLYWGEPETTQQDVVSFYSNGTVTFGRIETIALNLMNGKIMLSISEFDWESGHDKLYSYLNTNSDRNTYILKSVLDRYFLGDRTFCGVLKSTQTRLVVILLEDVIATATVIPLMLKKYCLSIPNKRCWQ
ncbi:unnamed protein product [Caenorhabditis auriculariae]|uniref:Uncharacterized protein n=1 Tax=Caenorhabditis auriculariae TaxID=2777116 RepID=A0A8S1HVU8_9PELO|nr:unnamed protein product [Caenorhabditis auriculariae]